MQRGGPSDHGSRAPDVQVIVDSDEEDNTYVPSEDDDTEDEMLDSEEDADLWLGDVKHPSSSRRFGSRR